MTREHMIQPEPFSVVSSPFILSGKLPNSWVQGRGDDMRISLDFLDIHGQVFRGSSIETQKKDDKQLFFSERIYLSRICMYWTQNSLGRITIKLSSFNDDIDPIYIPLIVQGFENKASGQIKDMQKKLPQTIAKYEEDLKKYDSKLKEIYSDRDNLYKKAIQSKDDHYTDIHEENIINLIYELIEGTPDSELDELKENYREAIEWRGPLCGGEMGRIEGFVIRAWSNDHGEHFHIIHKDRGIDARFSFPEMTLINYKHSKNHIKRKEMNRIQDYLRRPENVKKLSIHFKQRNG